MKLNKKLIKQLRNGEIAVENNGTVEQLREVLKAALPNSIMPPTGGYLYYSRSEINTNAWRAYSFKDESKASYIRKISDFYQPELFTGWAKDDNYPKWMVYFKDDVSKYGFSVKKIWIDKLIDVKYSDCDSNRPATHEEIEQRLSEEAKRRGYKGGETIKGLYGTTHWSYEISSFYYDQRWDRLLTNEGCIVYEAGQWAEIIEQPKAKPKTNPIHYTVGGTEYSLDYQNLKFRYEDICQYSDQQFLDELPQIAHLACVVSYLKGLGTQATISDKGIIHELIHLMTSPQEPTNDLQEIREKFNKLIQLV